MKKFKGIGYVHHVGISFPNVKNVETMKKALIVLGAHIISKNKQEQGCLLKLNENDNTLLELSVGQLGIHFDYTVKSIEQLEKTFSTADCRTLFVNPQLLVQIAFSERKEVVTVELLRYGRTSKNFCYVIKRVTDGWYWGDGGWTRIRVEAFSYAEERLAKTIAKRTGFEVIEKSS